MDELTWGLSQMEIHRPIPAPPRKIFESMLAGEKRREYNRVLGIYNKMGENTPQQKVNELKRQLSKLKYEYNEAKRLQNMLPENVAIIKKLKDAGITSYGGRRKHRRTRHRRRSAHKKHTIRRRKHATRKKHRRRVRTRRRRRRR